MCWNWSVLYRMKKWVRRVWLNGKNVLFVTNWILFFSLAQKVERAEWGNKKSLSWIHVLSLSLSHSHSLFLSVLPSNYKETWRITSFIVVVEQLISEKELWPQCLKLCLALLQNGCYNFAVELEMMLSTFERCNCYLWLNTLTVK